MARNDARDRITNKACEKEMARLRIELVKMQEWIRATGRRVAVLFEGRDAAGKGGAIWRILEPLNQRAARAVALPAPTDRERTQWHFQRYVAHLPSAGEIVLFDRSWYNRVGVERLLIRSGIQLIKCWFSVSDAEQERRFRKRATDPLKRWKLSPMDLESRLRWAEHSRAKDKCSRIPTFPIRLGTWSPAT